jgi:hypothetical protein
MSRLSDPVLPPPAFEYGGSGDGDGDFDGRTSSSSSAGGSIVRGFASIAGVASSLGSDTDDPCDASNSSMYDGDANSRASSRPSGSKDSADSSSRSARGSASGRAHNSDVSSIDVFAATTAHAACSQPIRARGRA